MASVTKALGSGTSNQRYYDYLEKLRESGEVNMFGAMPYLQRQFPELGLDINRARCVLLDWMKSYEDDREKKSHVRRE